MQKDPQSKRQKMNPKGIFFDWDLTLVDSFSGRGAFVDVFNRTFDVVLEKSTLQQVFSMSLWHAIEYLYNVLQPEQEFDEFQKDVKDMALSINRDFVIRDEHILHELKKDRILAIISNNEPENIEPVLAKYPKIFDGLWAGPTHKVEKMQLALKQFELNVEDVIYVGDHPTDIEASKALKITAVAIESPLFTAAELEVYKPDFVIQNLSDLLEYMR